MHHKNTEPISKGFLYFKFFFGLFLIVCLLPLFWLALICHKYSQWVFNKLGDRTYLDDMWKHRPWKKYKNNMEITE